MASSPQWKVYNAAKEYKAACKDVEDAACLIALYGNGATIRIEHTLVMWTEGAEDQPASESYDHVAETVHRRLGEHRQKITAKRNQEAAKYDPTLDPRYGDPKRG